MQKKDHEAIMDKISQLKDQVAVGEFAGRDSAAAIIKAMEDPFITQVLPIATQAPTEYGDFSLLHENCEATRQRLQKLHGNTKTLEDLMHYSHPDLWSALNGRFMKSLQQKYGFISPCIGCHAYFHLVRIPFALKLGKVIISGERESHDGRLKVNQLAPCLDSYQRITGAFGVKLLMPLRHMNKGEDVENLLGWDWPEGGGQPVCALSGNYRNPLGDVAYEADALHSFLEDFLYPVAVELGEKLINNPGIGRQEMLNTVVKRVE